MMLRVLVAAAFSVIAAAVMAGVIKYVLSTFADIGMGISPAVASMIMTYSWVAMFLVFFFSLFRSRLPLHRLLADMWHASAKPAAAVTAKVPVKLKLKPKHDRGAMSPQTLRDWQDLRTRRGDPDIFSTPVDMAPDLPQVNAQGVEIAKPAADRKAEPVAEKASPEKPKTVEASAPDKAAEEKAVQERIAKAKEKAAREQAATAKAAQEKQARETAAREKAAAEKAARDKAPLIDGVAAVAQPPVLQEEDDFAHVALGRFISAVVRPAAAAAMREDPVARRGMALAIAGAIDGIKSRPEVVALDDRALLSWGLRCTGMNDTVADLFLESHDVYVSQPANQSLVAAGQGVITDMIAPQSPDLMALVAALSAAFAAWRTPFGQPGLLVEASGAAEAAEALRDHALADAFLITEMRPPPRHDDPAQDDARMAGHNDRVRAALGAGGTEIKHTGKGIFARFTDAAGALAAAKGLQADLGPAVALTVIGNTDAGEDPVLSPTLFLRAEAAIGLTGDGQIAVEAQVIGEDQRIGQPTELVILAPLPEPAPP